MVRDRQSPTVSISSPIGGEVVSGTTTIKGTASDNVGITRVDVKIGSGSFQTVSGTTSWSLNWDTTKIGNGSVTLTVRAYDSRGNYGQAATTVNVSNQVTAPPPDPAPTQPPASGVDPTADAVTPNPTWQLELAGSTANAAYSSSGGRKDFESLDGIAADFHIIADPAGGSKKVFQAYVSGNPGPYSDHDRTLGCLNPHTSKADARSGAWQGDETWYRDQLYFPSAWTPQTRADADAPFNFIWEMHAYPDNPGPGSMLALCVMTKSDSKDGYSDGLGVTTPRLALRITAGGSSAHPCDGMNSATVYSGSPGNDVKWDWFTPLMMPLIRDKWIDLVFHVRWDWRARTAYGNNPGGGNPIAEMWVNDEKKVTWTNPTLFYYADTLPGASGTQPGGGQGYLELGLYRDRQAGVVDAIDHRKAMIGPTQASIGKAGLVAG